MIMNQEEFYEGQQMVANESVRSLSETIFLKSFNNFIKTIQIKMFMKKFTVDRGRGLSVLDLCCGRGGDLPKWTK